MASDFVRKVKGIRNIDILSPNITTENDLISTIDGEVYVATKKGYKIITNVEAQDFEKLKTKVENLNNQSETNTTDIGTLKTDVGTNTSEIETLKTNTETNTTDIGTLKTDVGTLKTDVGTNTSEIETLKTDTDNNTSEIGTLKTDTTTNTTSINDLLNKINNLTETINKLNEYIEIKTFNDIDLMDKDSLNTLPLGVNYVAGAKNKTAEMSTNSGWLTVHYANNVKRLLFQPFSDGRTYYNFIYKDVLEEWK